MHINGLPWPLKSLILDNVDFHGHASLSCLSRSWKQEVNDHGQRKFDSILSFILSQVDEYKKNSFLTDHYHLYNIKRHGTFFNKIVAFNECDFPLRQMIVDSQTLLKTKAVLALCFADIDFLEYTSEEVKNNWELFEALIWKGKATAIQYASKKLVENENFAALAITKTVEAIKKVPSKLFLTSKKVIQACFKHDLNAYRFDFSLLQKISPSLWDDDEVVRLIVSYKAEMLLRASPRLKADKNLTLLAIRIFHNNSQFMKPNFNDKDYLRFIRDNLPLPLINNPEIQIEIRKICFNSSDKMEKSSERVSLGSIFFCCFRKKR